MAEITPTEHETAALARAITRASGIARDDETGRVPIVAAVMVDDHVVAWGDNEVHVDHDPTRHAEIVAIAAACAELERPSLEGATLVTTLQPCEMCLGAMRVAGIDRLIFAAGRPNVDDMYFKFHGLDLDDFARAADAPFAWAGHVMEEDVLRLYSHPEP